jgi:predicted acetyltransferase
VAVDESVFKVFMEWRPLSPVVHFERPSAEFAESFAAMRDAFMAIGDNRWQRFMAIAHRDPFAYAEMQRDRSEGKSLPDGFVRTDVFWIVLEDVVVGECHVRHILTPEPENIGGNIGYQVHPEYRNRGIATFALREALGVTARIGMHEALITCAPDNGASIRVIEKCGGRRIEAVCTGVILFLPTANDPVTLSPWRCHRGPVRAKISVRSRYSAGGDPSLADVTAAIAEA